MFLDWVSRGPDYHQETKTEEEQKLDGVANFLPPLCIAVTFEPVTQIKNPFSF